MIYDQKHKILLADDEPQNIKYLFEALDPGTYRIFAASNGKSAVVQTLRYRPDAIIMDWDMPEMNGMEAIRAIRATEEVKNVPVIVATGKMTSMENLRTALETGANDYIRKPYDPIEITARLESMIRLNREQQKNIRLEKAIMQQKIDKVNHEIEINAQALTTSKLRLINNSKNNQSLIKELEHIREASTPNIKKMINKMISGLKANNTSFNWKAFENHFEKVHPSFFTILHTHYPNLTSNETELSVFIKLDMTSREILAITGKTNNALKKARQRLKKKLGLNAEASLTRFIQEMK